MQAARPANYRMHAWLLAAHSLVMLLVLLSTYRAIQSQQWSGLYLQGQLLYGVLIYVLILRLESLSDLIRPSSMFVVFTYLAYFIKGVVYLFNQDLYLHSWITLNSPLAHSTFRDWAVAMTAAAVGLTMFCIGYWIVNRVVPAKPAMPAVKRQRSGNPLPLLLAGGAAMVLLRVFVTWRLGVGASHDASDLVFLIPGLSGFLSMLSIWGGRLTVAAAFAVAATTRSVFGVCVAIAEMLALGALSTIATGSKSELLLAIVVLMMTAFALRNSMPRHIFQMGAAVSAATILAVVVVYPAFHNYRYVRKEMDIATYLQRHQSEMSLADGSKDVLRRLNGLEYLTMVVTYYELNGYQPRPQLNYQPFILKMLFGVPEHIVIGLGVGPFGGLLLIGGWTFFPLLCVLLGMGVRMAEMAVDMAVSPPELRAVMLVVLSIAVVNWLMFSGHFSYLAKELLTIIISSASLCLVCGDMKRSIAPVRRLDRSSRRLAA